MEDGSIENEKGIQEQWKSRRCRDVKNTENLDEAGSPNYEQTFLHCYLVLHRYKQPYQNLERETKLASVDAKVVKSNKIS